MVEIKKMMNWRYATKKFSDRKLDGKDFDELLEVLRLSPSSYGLQLWKFIVVENKELREKIKVAAYGQRQATEASNLIVLCAKKGPNKGEVDALVESTAKIRSVGVETLEGFRKMLIGLTKREDKEEWAKKQVYLALGFLLSVCAMKKIDACPMEGFDSNKVDKILELDKQELNSVVLCAVGYRADDDKYALAKKVRFDKKDIVEVR